MFGNYWGSQNQNRATSYLVRGSVTQRSSRTDGQLLAAWVAPTFGDVTVDEVLETPSAAPRR